MYSSQRSQSIVQPRQPLPTRQPLPVRQLPTRQALPQSSISARAPLPRQPLHRHSLSPRSSQPTQQSQQPPRQALPPRNDATAQRLTSVSSTAPRQPVLRGGALGAGRSASDNRFAPLYRKPEHDAQPIRAKGQFNVNMGSRPPVMDTPQFGAASHLRRRTDSPIVRRVSPTEESVPEQRSQENTALPSFVYPNSTQPRTDSPIQKLDKNELARLLGTAPAPAPVVEESTRTKMYTPLARKTATQTKCLLCGGLDHQSQDCLQKPIVRATSEQAQGPWAYRDRNTRQGTNRPEQVFGAKHHEDAFDRLRPAENEYLRSKDAQSVTAALQGKFEFKENTGPGQRYQNPESQRPRQTESLSAAAEAWAQKTGSRMESMENERVYEDMDQRRRREDGIDRRRSRFIMDDDTPASEAREPERRRGRADKRARGGVTQMDDDLDDRVVSKVEQKRLRKEAKKAAQLLKPEPTPVYLPEYISVANLASMLKLRVEDFVRKLEELGFEEVQNDHILNAEHAGLIAQEYNFEPVLQTAEEDHDLYAAPPLSPEEYAKLPVRPPVVTIMGHVDHGKTTILDFMRNSSVAASEFGGITQHIGAFSVPLASGKKITFLDTPGHAAFETMRARGANVTDIVVLVVAADDSVMPQTVEAIKHAQTARVPLIVAINKIDKPQANAEAVKLDLGRHGIEIEDFGGDVQTVCVSGKTGQGIPDLEEAISTLSEMLDHRADPQANVEGWILEGSTKKSGKVATVLIRNGTLRPGDLLVAGTTWTRVKTLKNEAGVIVKEVGPGLPVEVDGWREQPIAGDEALQAVDEQTASAVAELRAEKVEREQMARDVDAINKSRQLEAERREAEEAAEAAAKAGEDIPEEVVKVKESGPEIISFIVKGDVSGSVEAVIDSISSIGNAEIGTKVLRHGVGPPSEFDIEHAAVAKGHIVNFNTVVPSHISALAAEKGVLILDSNIIYRVVENVKALLSEKLGPKITQRVVGEAEVAAVFDISLGGKKKMKVAGSKVRNGVISNNSKVKVLRNEQKVFEGTFSFLLYHLERLLTPIFRYRHLPQEPKEGRRPNA
jgi:translation initiation factor IF-2